MFISNVVYVGFDEISVSDIICCIVYLEVEVIGYINVGYILVGCYVRVE